MLCIIFYFGITCLGINIKASLRFHILKMMKSAIIGSMLLGVALSGYVTDIDNNLIEYDLDDLQPMQFSFPYPYQGRNPHVVIEPAPVYSNPHRNIIVPSTTELEVVYPGIVYTAISCAYQAAKTAIVFLLSHVPALATGTAVALGVCKMTSLCSPQITIYEAQRELRSIASSDTITSVTEFLKEAIRKYNDMQLS